MTQPSRPPGATRRLGLLAAISLVLASIGASPARAGGLILEGPFSNPANGHSYFTVLSTDFADARAFATAVGGYVASIGDAVEQQWLLAHFPILGSYHAIGLTDEASPGTYAWETGEPVTFTDWAPGEPIGLSSPRYARGLAGWQTSEFNWTYSALIEADSAVLGGVPSLLCTTAPGGVEIAWAAPGFDSVRIVRDGQLIAVVAASAGTYLDTPPPGTDRYILAAVGSAGTSLPAVFDAPFPDPNYVIRVPDAQGPHPGPVATRVLLDAIEPVQGFSFGICYDTAALDLVGVAEGAAILAAMPGGADFFNVWDAPNGYTVGVVINFVGSAVLPPGNALELVVASFLAPGSSPLLEPLRPCAEIGSPPVSVQVVVAGVSIHPLPLAGTVRLGLEDFRRGDGNVDGSIDIADVLFLGLLLFDPTVNDYPCREAFETNGDGQIDIADMIYSLAYLFSGGPPPGAPFPGCGPDPDLPDGFPCDDPSPCP